MSANAQSPHRSDARKSSPNRGSDGFRVGMILYEEMTLLELVGPQEILARVPGVETHLIGAGTAPITTESGARILPDTTFDNAPPLNMLFVPGGPGVTMLMQDKVVLAFLRERGTTARWITSVGTGALVLGAAGLLVGRRAATHWSATDLLPRFGALPSRERVVVDGNRITAGGGTAGLDFGLSLVAHIWGAGRAQSIQLDLEYDPKPPFEAGSPETATPVVVDALCETNIRSFEQRRYVAEHAAAALCPGD